jgi:hypothetical protein
MTSFLHREVLRTPKKFVNAHILKLTTIEHYVSAFQLSRVYQVFVDLENIVVSM